MNWMYSSHLCANYLDVMCENQASLHLMHLRMRTLLYYAGESYCATSHIMGAL